MSSTAVESDFKVFSPSSDMDDARVIIEFRDTAQAEYTKGAELETDGGTVIEPDTACLEIISVDPDVRGQGNRIGTRLMARVLEQMREDGFMYMRATTVNPLMIKMMERAVKEERLRRVAYHPKGFDDAPSRALLEDPHAVPAAEAMPLVDRQLVEFVAEL